MTFKAVRIIHNILTRIDFSFLAEFFRLAGIYVVECIDNEDDESPYQNNENCFDITIDTCGSEKAFDYGPSLNFEEIKNKIDIEKNIRHWSDDNQVKALETVLEQMALLLGETPPGICWKTLIQKYVSFDIMLHSLNLQYYFRKASYAIENLQSAFYAVQNEIGLELKKIDANDAEKKYLEYARIYCKIKVNAGCKFMRQGFEFPIEELADECTVCVNRYFDFSNLKVLLGLCYEYEPVYASMAIRAFALALEEENEYCYSSNIYYWIGKQYEAYQANWQDAVQNYQLSYKRKHKYKNMYKLAIAKRVDCKYEEAIDGFRWIIKKLEDKLKLNMADPLELEYYFKAKAMIATIYFNDLKNYFSAIEWGEDLIRIYDDLVDGDNYFTQFYCSKAKNYRELSKQRFDLKRVRSILYYSYHYLGIEEKAVQYMNMKDYEE